MKTTDNQHYKADEGCFIVRKEDQVIMGEAIDLGSADSIDNYTEKAFTEEEIANYRKEWGIAEPQEPDRPKGRTKRK